MYMLCQMITGRVRMIGLGQKIELDKSAINLGMLIHLIFSAASGWVLTSGSIELQGISFVIPVIDETAIQFNWAMLRMEFWMPSSSLEWQLAVTCRAAGRYHWEENHSDNLSHCEWIIWFSFFFVAQFPVFLLFWFLSRVRKEISYSPFPFFLSHSLSFCPTFIRFLYSPFLPFSHLCIDLACLSVYLFIYSSIFLTS